MSIATILLVIGVALGAAGYHFANPALSGWAFAAAVAALMVWLCAQRVGAALGKARRHQIRRSG